MKIAGAPLADDVKRVRRVRAAIGEDVKLLLDANNGYRLHEALVAARELAEFDIYWLEEPLMPDDYAGHAKLSAISPIPIALGEIEYTRYGFRDIIEHGAATILNPDAQFSGGVTEFMKIVALAQAHDLAIAPHGNPELHVQLAAAAPNALIVEVARIDGDSIWDMTFPSEWMSCPVGRHRRRASIPAPSASRQDPLPPDEPRVASAGRAMAIMRATLTQPGWDTTGRGESWESLHVDPRLRRRHP